MAWVRESQCHVHHRRQAWSLVCGVHGVNQWMDQPQPRHDHTRGSGRVGAGLKLGRRNQSGRAAMSGVFCFDSFVRGMKFRLENCFQRRKASRTNPACFTRNPPANPLLFWRRNCVMRCHFWPPHCLKSPKIKTRQREENCRVFTALAESTPPRPIAKHPPLTTASLLESL